MEPILTPPHQSSAPSDLTLAEALKQAIAHHRAGRLPDAERLYRTILQALPRQPEANHNLGVLALEVGKAQAALPFLKIALEGNPKERQFWLSYINALIQAGQTEAARQVLKLGRQQGLQGDAVEALADRLPEGEMVVPLPALENSTIFEQASTAQTPSREPRREAQALSRQPGKGPEEKEMIDLANMFNAARYVETLPLARTMVERYPQDGFGWKVLGAVHAKLGQHADALLAKEKAVSLSPYDAEAHSNHGQTLFDLGRLAEAEASCRRALAINPDHALAYICLGKILFELGRLEEAEINCRRALALKPDIAEAYNLLGSILDDQGRLSEAETSYREALTLTPGNAEMLVNLGITLRLLGRTEEAEASLRRALEIQPSFAKARAALGDVFWDKGQFNEAQALYQRVLEAEPRMPTALAALAYSRKMTDADEDWLATAEKIVVERLSAREAVTLYYAMGKFCDDTKRYERAFACYQKANALQKGYCADYDRGNEERLTERIVQSYTQDVVTKPRGAANPSKLPVFVVGMPRSGTSLIEQIIASHPTAVGAGELLFWFEQVNRHQQELLSANVTAPLLTQIASDCLQNLRRHSADALRVVDKMPSNYLYLGLIHAVFPGARILHSQRNPIDTCLSIYFQSFNISHAYANDLADIAHCYREYHRLMAHWRSVLPEEVFLDVPYEALVEDHEGWSRKIMEFIGLEWNEGCRDFHKTERRVGTASNWQVRQPVYKTSKERWRNYEKFVGPLLPLLDLYDEGTDSVGPAHHP